MKRSPLHARIPAALSLAPMSAGALARCLGSTRRNVWKLLRELTAAGAIERCGAERNHAGPARHLYRIAA